MITGIISGIIASGIFLLLTSIIKYWIWPQIRDSMYRGTRIDGEWEVCYEGSTDIAARMTFKQTGTKIVGNSHIIKNRSGNDVNRKYILRGTFLDKSIILTFQDKNNPSMIGGAMVIHHTDSDAMIMKGKSIYFKPEYNEVDVSVVNFYRKSVCLTR